MTGNDTITAHILDEGGNLLETKEVPVSSLK